MQDHTQETIDAEFSDTKNEAPIVEATEYKEMVSAEGLKLIDLKQAAIKCGYEDRNTIAHWEKKQKLPVKKASTHKHHSAVRVLDINWLRDELVKKGKNFNWIDAGEWDEVKPINNQIEVTDKTKKKDAAERHEVVTTQQTVINKIDHVQILIGLEMNNKKIGIVLKTCVVICSLTFIFIAYSCYSNFIISEKNKETIKSINTINTQLLTIQKQMKDNQDIEKKELEKLIEKSGKVVEEAQKYNTPFYYFWKK